MLQVGGLLAMSILACLCTLSATSQSRNPASVKIEFSQVTELERHLPQSSIYSIVEDRDGFLWFATREGVGRWDGYSMTTWKHDPYNESTIPGNIVRQMVQDGSGDIWVATQNYQQRDVGIARIKAPAFNSVTRFDHLQGRLVLNLQQELLVVSADSIYLFESEHGNFRGILGNVSSNDEIGDVIVDSDGDAWIAHSNGAIDRCDFEVYDCKNVIAPTQSSSAGVQPIPEASSLLESDSGKLWIAQVGALGWMDKENASVNWIRELPSDLAISLVSDLAEDRDGNLWILTSTGVYVMKQTSSGVSFEQYPLLTFGLDTENLAPIMLHIDRSGNVWVGTVFGLYRHSPYVKQFRHLQHDPSNPSSLSAGLVVSLAEDNEGNIWVGTIGGGLNKVDAELNVSRYRRQSWNDASLSNDVVWALQATSDGRVFAGTSWGMSEYRKKRNDFRRHLIDPLVNDFSRHLGVASVNSVAGMVVDRDDILWISDPVSTGKITWYNSNTETFGSESLPDSVDVGYMMVDDSNNLWFGSSRGIYRWKLPDGRAELFAHSPGAGGFDGILSFHRDDDSTVWIGTNSGLYEISPEGDIGSRITSEEGLPSSTVYSILDDDYGRLWVSTNRGIASLDFTTSDSLPRVSSYDDSNGIRNTEFNRNAYLKASDGTLYFGGETGVTFFDPKDILPNTYIPPIVITAVERATRTGGSRLPFVNSGDPLRIRPDEVTFTFEFAALSFVNSNRNKYAVRLEGWDESWIDLDGDRRISYSNLPPGEYRFRVIGSNEDGVWNYEGASVDVIVEPSFWQTWWFSLLLVLAIGAVIIFVTWIVSRQRFERQLNRVKAQRALESERNRISRDMHDEVGANLTEISILSELALRQQGDGSDTFNILSRIAGKSRDMLDSIGEIIWAINPQNDSGQRFTPYLREYAASYCENVGLSYQFDFPVSTSGVVVTSEFRRNVFLILKEALTNIVKHAEASKVWVSLEYADDTLKMLIRDDGCGAGGADLEPRGNGLGNMRHRSEEIGGSVTLSSVPRGGTQVTLVAPLPVVELRRVE